MSTAYVIGHITVKNAEKWAEYRNKVPATLEPWGAELVLRGKRVTILAGEHPHSDIVVIRFSDNEAVNNFLLITSISSSNSSAAAGSGSGFALL